MPASRSATINSEVATGRRMNCRDGFMRYAAFSALLLALLPRAFAAGPRFSRVARRARSLALACHELDLRALPQLVGAVDDDQSAWADAAVDRRRFALHGPDLHGLHAHRAIVIDREYECARCAPLDCSVRHERR